MSHANTTPPTPDAPKLPVTSRWAASERTATTVALVVALVGLSLPYGTSTPGTDEGLTVLEWVVSGLALLGAAALLVDLLRPLYPRLKASGYGFLGAAFVWMTAAVYVLLHGATIGWLDSVHEALFATGMAILAGYEWRRIVLANKATPGGHDG